MTRRGRMSEEQYEPVSCDYHDELEAAAMHKQQVELEFDLEGVTQRETGTIADVYTAEGAEFVKFVAGTGPIDIRLDHIISMKGEEGVGGGELEKSTACASSPTPHTQLPTPSSATLITHAQVLLLRRHRLLSFPSAVRGGGADVAGGRRRGCVRSRTWRDRVGEERGVVGDHRGTRRGHRDIDDLGPHGSAARGAQRVRRAVRAALDCCRRRVARVDAAAADPDVDAGPAWRRVRRSRAVPFRGRDDARLLPLAHLPGGSGGFFTVGHARMFRGRFSPVPA